MSGPATGTRHLTRPSPRLHQTRTAARVRAPAGTLRGVQDALQPALGAGCPAAHKTTFDTTHLVPVPGTSTARTGLAFSGGRRNALQVVGEELSEGFARGVVAEALAGAVVELAGDGLEPAGVWWLRSVPLGRYSRSRPLMFSLLPRCQ